MESPAQTQSCMSEGGGAAAELSAFPAPRDFSVLRDGAAWSLDVAGSHREHPDCQGQATALLCDFGSFIC